HPTEPCVVTGDPSRCSGPLRSEPAGAQPKARPDYRVSIVNSSGLSAEMCGNRARCVARFARRRGPAPATHPLPTVAGLIRAEVGPDAVCVGLTDPRDAQLDRRIEVDGAELTLDSLDTGVPHAVIWTDDLDRAEVEWVGRMVRHHPAFPRGTNANFA